MRNKRAFAFVIIFSIVTAFCAVNYASATQAIGVGASANVSAPEISAPSAILLEAETGQVLYSKNIEQALHISAACKLMTVLVAIENADMNSMVTVSSDSVVVEGSTLNLEIGAKYPLEDLLYAIMLTSANDAAQAIAEHIGSGDLKKFVNRMNATASKLNMTHTHFTNPTGLFENSQFTTAADIALLVRYAIGNSTFNKIFSTKVRPWYDSKGNAEVLTSSNDLFWLYDGIEGGKTGYNVKEQQSVIATAVRMNLELICIVLDAPDTEMTDDATSLFDYGFSNFRKDTLVRKGEVLKTVNFEDNEINLISQVDIIYVHPLGESYIKKFSAFADLEAPVRKAIPAGTATYVLKDDTTINISLYPESEIIPPEGLKTRIKDKILENKDLLYLLLLLVAIEIVLFIYHMCRLVKKLILKLRKT